MNLLENWQALISSNLANASTPGFQKSTFEISSTAPEASEETSSRHMPLPVGSAQRVFSDGQIRTTGNPFDLSIRSGGFFGLTDDKGEQVFTKDGEFHLNNEGTIVNKMGWPLLAGGAPITIELQQGPITVATDGTISQKGQDVGRVSVYNFTNPQELDQGNGSYFFNPGNQAGMTEVEDPLVLQGQLMGSSVSPLTEMVSMIQVSRAYEISQKLIQENDQRRGTVIQTFSV